MYKARIDNSEITVEDFIEKPYLRHIALYNVMGLGWAEDSGKYKKWTIVDVYQQLSIKFNYKDVREIYKYLIWYWESEVLSKKDLPNREELLNSSIENLWNLAYVQSNYDALQKLVVEPGKEHFNSMYQDDNVFDYKDFWFHLFQHLHDCKMTKPIERLLMEELFQPQDLFMFNILDYCIKSDEEYKQDYASYFEKYEAANSIQVLNTPLSQLGHYKISTDWDYIPKKLKSKYEAMELAHSMIRG